ncbi:solute carrier family 25 member 38 -like protein [Kluyveromyces marxianus]|uniref:Mitochondrial glycine transporter n=1 Tax=Kluyveromyces marxianus TaxID=4911 RepID=A0ABX6F1H5_KLUMA|nr:solute carrier family 25 member 38 -like protein [Kluyveromyces marxianus]
MTDQQRKPTTHLIGGFCGGLVSAIILQPFDLVKTRLQQDNSSTLWSTLKKIETPGQLWRGALPSCIRTSVGSAIYLTMLNSVRQAMSKGKSKAHGSSYLPQLNMYENMISGALTRALTGLLTMPITIIKVRYESTMYNYTSLSDATRHIFATNGIRGFFTGFGATALRDAPYAGLYMLFYDRLKEIVPTLLPNSLVKLNKNQHYSTYTSTLINGSSAFSAAVIATSITAPFDTVKTRMQLDPSKFNRFTSTFWYIASKEGIRHLFDGLSLRLTRKAFSAGIAWGIYEEIIKRFV